MVDFRVLRVWSLGAAVGFAVLLSATSCFAQTAPAYPSFVVRSDAEVRRQALNARVFDQVVSTVDAQFYDPHFNGVDWQGLSQSLRPRAVAAVDERELYAVIADLLAPLDDDHVNADGPSVRALIARAQAPTVSAGVIMQTVDRREEVARVRIGGPADKAGVRPGWTLEAIDGAPVAYSVLLTARPGQVMHWRMIDQEDATHDIVLVLEPPVPPRQPRRLDEPAPGVFRLAWDQFTAGDARWMDEILGDLPEGASVVLDLRGNSGGSIRELRAILGCFLPHGTPVFVTTSRDGAPQVLETLPDCRPFNGKVVSLVDHNSASASEMLAMALIEANRAPAVGQRTAGAVLVSRSTDLADGGRLSVTRSDFHTIRGVRMEKVGLQPSVEAVTTFDDEKAGRDPALDVAVALLLAP